MRVLSRLLVVSCVALAPVGAAAQFTEIAGDVGLQHRALKDGGLTWADFDHDGDLDVLVNSGNRTSLYFSSGGPDPTFTDVTMANAEGITRRRADRSAVAADLNNDGYTDILRTDQQLFEIYLNGGPSTTPPYRFGTGSGDPDFVLDTSNDPDLDAYEGVGVLDYDRDGWLDVVLDNDAELRLLRNPADGTAAFTTVPPAGLGLPGPTPGPNGDYVAVVDWDVDGWVDIARRSSALEDLHRNRGDGTFDAVQLAELRSPNGRRGGIAFCDFDNDGDFDFFYTSGEGAGVNRVWRQLADGTFEDTGEPSISSSSVDGVACGDVDNDGDEDLFVSRSGDDQLWINQRMESGMLGWVRDDRGIRGSDDGEGAVLVDYDRDGDLDLYVSQVGPTVTDPMTMVSTTMPGDNELWRNGLDSDAYLAVEVLAEVRGCPDASVTRVDHGAVVSVSNEASGFSSGVHDLSGGMGHGTQGSPVLHFGLPDGADAEHVVTVRFQHGAEPTARVRVTPSALGSYQLLTVVSSDPDGDGIPTAVEMADASAFGGSDLDGDGFPAWHDADADGDSIPDAVEAGDSDPCTAPADADGTGTPDYLEVPGVPVPDAGIPPGVDAGPVTPPTDGSPAATGLRAHGSGLLQCSTRPGGAAPPWWLSLLAAVGLGRSVRRRR